MISKKIIFVFFFIFWLLILKSQKPYLKNYSIKDGLPTCETYHVFQDSKGFIWIATDFGVCRYDGYAFQNFDCTEGLPDNTILEIYEDYKGRIWFIPFSSKLSYFEDDSIHIFKYNDILREQIKDIYMAPPKRSFFIDNMDNMYYSQNVYEAFKISPKGKIEKFNRIYTNEKDLIYVKKNFGAFGIQNKLEKSNILRIIHDKKSIIINDSYDSDDPIKSIITCKNDDIFFFRRSGLIYKLSNFKVVQKFQHKYTPVWISIDSKKNIWIATIENGVFCYDYARFNTEPIYHLLENQCVTSVMEDREGGYWFSTTGNGIYYMPSKDIQIINDEKHIQSSDIQCIDGIRNKLFIGTSVSHLNRINKNINLFDFSITEFPTGVSGALFYDDSKKAVYFCFFSGKQVIYKYDAKELSKLPVKVNGKMNNNITLRALCMSPGKDGIIWVGDHKGIYKIKNDTVIIEEKSYNIDIRINSLLQKDENNLYIASKSGLYKFMLKNQEMDSLVYMGSEDKLFKSRADDLLLNPVDSSLWIATRGNGILICKSDTIIRSINSKNGLTSSFITVLHLDAENSIWAGTNNGLNRIETNNTKKNRFNIKTFSIGLSSNKINDIYTYNGNIYLATNKGITFFNKDLVKPNTVRPYTYISGFSIAGEDTILLKHYDLPYNKNSVSISFVGLSFKKSQSLRYVYKLSKNKNPSRWMLTNNTNINYPFLPPGQYKFSVYALNEDNYQSDETAEISFTVKPPFWQTIWFIVCIVLCISLLAFVFFFLVYRIKLKELNKRTKLEKRLTDYLSKAIQKQMNPHFIFNSLNSIQNFIMKNDKFNSSRYLSIFSKLIRIVLVNSNKHLVSLESELESLKLYIDLEMLRFDHKFIFEFSIDEYIRPSEYFIPPMIIQPFVENAILHGLAKKESDGILKIRLVKTLEGITCVVEDNGIGRQKAKEISLGSEFKRKSLGSKLTLLRINLINSLNTWKLNVEYEDLYDIDRVPSGTKVILSLPKLKESSRKK